MKTLTMDPPVKYPWTPRFPYSGVSPSLATTLNAYFYITFLCHDVVLRLLLSGASATASDVERLADILSSYKSSEKENLFKSRSNGFL